MSDSEYEDLPFDLEVAGLPPLRIRCTICQGYGVISSVHHPDERCTRCVRGLEDNRDAVILKLAEMVTALEASLIGAGIPLRVYKGRQKK